MDPLKLLVNNIKKDLKLGKLQVPSLPEVAFRIRAAIRDDNKSAFQVAKLIQLDPVLTARLIQVANSTLYRANQPVEGCQAAISRIGVVAVRNLVTSFAMQQVYGARNQKIHAALKASWQVASHVAAICYVLGRVTPGIQPDRALLAGLIHNIGALPIFRYAETYPEALEDMPRFSALIKSIGAKLGRQVLMAWEMDTELIEIPEQITNSTYQYERAINYTDITIVAYRHYEVSEQENPDFSSLAQISSFKKLPVSRFGTSGSLELVEQAKEEIGDIVTMMR